MTRSVISRGLRTRLDRLASLLLFAAGCSTIHLANPRPGESAPRIAWSESIGEVTGAPAVALDGTVIAPAKDGLYAFTADGRALWVFRDGADFRTPPIDAQGRVLALSKGGLALLEGATGRKLWSKNSSVLEAIFDGAGGVYARDASTLFALDPSGKELWRVRMAINATYGGGRASPSHLFLLRTGPALAWGYQGRENSLDVERFDPRGRVLGDVTFAGEYETPFAVTDDGLVALASRVAHFDKEDSYPYSMQRFDAQGNARGTPVRTVEEGFPLILDDEGSLYTEAPAAFSSEDVKRWEFKPDPLVYGSDRYSGLAAVLGPDHTLYSTGLRVASDKQSSDLFLFAIRADGSERWSMQGPRHTVLIGEDAALPPQLAIGLHGVLFVAIHGTLSAVDTGTTQDANVVAFSDQIRPGRSPFAAAAGTGTIAAAAAAPVAAPTAEATAPGVTASAGQRFEVKKGAKVAVLNFNLQTAEVKKSESSYLADVVRAALLSALAGVDVIDRDNLVVLMQASGKTLADCEGECEVETGRRIGADLVVSGELLRFGKKLKLSLRLHETASGKLLASAVAEGDSLEQLEDRAKRAAASLAETVRVAP